MSSGAVVAIVSVSMTLLAMFASAIGLLLRSTWHLSSIVSRIEALEEKQSARDKREDEVDRALRDVEAMKSQHSELRAEVRRQGLIITEIRIATGVIDARASQGDVG